MLVVVAVAVFYLTGGFAFYCFSTSSFTLPWAIAEFLHSFYTFSPAHRRVICGTSNLTFLGYLSDTVLSGCFSSTGAIYPTLLRLWLRCGQEQRFWVGVFHPRALFTLHSFVCDSDAGRNIPSRIFLCVCPHRVVPSSWRMDLNYWCLNYKTIHLSFVPVSHEVLS